MSNERLLDPQAASQLLRHYSIPLANERVVHNPAEAGLAAVEMGFPVALKVLSPAFSHKTDAGLVRLNLGSQAEVSQAAAELVVKVGAGLAPAPKGLAPAPKGFAPAQGCAQDPPLLVQEMVMGGVEMIAGVTSDPQFGPVILVGSGGILVELLEDAVLALPPLTHAQALELLKQTRSWKLLQGFRGSPAGDVYAMQELIVNLARLAVGAGLKPAPTRIKSLDLNPVIILPQGRGVKVVDYRAYEWVQGASGG